jgi:hypothetical protein
MFGDVWQWAGSFRATERNIGIQAYRIGITSLLDDIRYWIEHETFPPDEITIKFHHRLVAIHPFPNGNGSHSRLAADLLIERLGGEPFSWDDGSLTNVGELQARYVTALRAADNRNIGPLLNFARSKRAQEFSHVNRITLESFPRWIWCCRLGLSLQGGGNCISSHQGPSNVPAARNLMPSPLPGHHIPFTENKP